MLPKSSENILPIVVGIGEILWDMLPSGRRLGGAPTNFAYHVNALGIRAAVVSGVGSDSLGDDISAQIVHWQMSTDCLFVRPEYPTGIVQVEIDAKGSPKYVIAENVAWDHIPWDDRLEDLAPSVRAVCWGTLGQRGDESRDTIRRFVKSIADDCLRICDINLRQRFYNDDLLRDCLELANIVKLNDEELPIVADALGLKVPEEERLSALRERFDLKLIALTRGSAGSILLTADRLSEHSGFPTQVVDTVGAGDSFTAGLTVGVLNGDDLDTINASANRIAAWVCSFAGATPENGVSRQ